MRRTTRMPQSSLLLRHPVCVGQALDAVIVSCIKHHSSPAAGRADCSPLLSYHNRPGTLISQGPSVCVCKCSPTDDSLHPVSTYLSWGRFLHSQLVSRFPLHVQCGRESNAHLHLSMTPSPPSILLLDYCVSVSISSSIILPPAICSPAQTGSEGLCRHMSPSACRSMESCWLLIDEAQHGPANENMCHVLCITPMRWHGGRELAWKSVKDGWEDFYNSLRSRNPLRISRVDNDHTVGGNAW